MFYCHHNYNRIKIIFKLLAHTLNALCPVTKTITQPGTSVKILPMMNQSIESTKSWTNLICASFGQERYIINFKLIHV